MSRDELIKAIQDMLKTANLRELDLIFRILKNMASD